jgi:hypothetical protein
VIPTSRRTAMDHPLFRPESNIAARASCPLPRPASRPADKTGQWAEHTGLAARLALQLELGLPRLLPSPAPEGSFDGLRAFSRNSGRRARPTSPLPLPLQGAEPFVLPRLSAEVAERAHDGGRPVLVLLSTSDRSSTSSPPSTCSITNTSRPLAGADGECAAREVEAVSDDQVRAAVDAYDEAASASSG